MATRHDLYEWVRAGHRARAVEIGLDLKRLNRPGSPVFSLADNAVPVLALLAMTALATGIGGYLFGGGAAVVAVVVAPAAVRVYALRRVRDRAVRMAFGGVESWQSLWDAGALSLRVPGRPGTETESRDEDWRKFAVRHLRHERGWKP